MTAAAVLGADGILIAAQLAMTHLQVFDAFLLAALASAGPLAWLAAIRRWRQGGAIVRWSARRQVPWIFADVIFVAVLQMAMQLIIVSLIAGRGNLLVTDVTPEKLFAVTAANVLWIAAGGGYLTARGAALRDLGVVAARVRDDVRLGLLTFCAAAPVVYGIQWALVEFFQPTVHPIVKLVSTESSPAVLLLVAFSAVVVAPLGEELFFRVVLQGWLERSLRIALARRWQLRERQLFRRALQDWLDGCGRLLARHHAVTRAVIRNVPILISAALFALMHEGLDRIPLFVLALFLGYLYRQTHRLLPSLVVHFCVNLLAILQLGLSTL